MKGTSRRLYEDYALSIERRLKKEFGDHQMIGDCIDDVINKSVKHINNNKVSYEFTYLLRAAIRKLSTIIKKEKQLQAVEEAKAVETLKSKQEVFLNLMNMTKGDVYTRLWKAISKIHKVSYKFVLTARLLFLIPDNVVIKDNHLKFGTIKNYQNVYSKARKQLKKYKTDLALG